MLVFFFPPQRQQAFLLMLFSGSPVSDRATWSYPGQGSAVRPSQLLGFQPHLADFCQICLMDQGSLPAAASPCLSSGDIISQ